MKSLGNFDVESLNYLKSALRSRLLVLSDLVERQKLIREEASVDDEADYQHASQLIDELVSDRERILLFLEFYTEIYISPFSSPSCY